MQIFNAKTQQSEEVVFSVDPNREIIATFPDGHFLKFPAGTSKEDLLSLIEEHEAANQGQEIITPEMEAAAAAEREAAEALVNELNSDNTMSEEDKTHDPQQSSQA